MSEVTSLGREILPGRTNSTELVVAGIGGLTNEVLYAVEENADAFDRVRERDCDIVKICTSVPCRLCLFSI